MLQTRSHKQKFATPVYVFSDGSNWLSARSKLLLCAPSFSAILLEIVFHVIHYLIFLWFHLDATALTGLIRIIYLFIYSYFPNHLKT